MKPSTEYTAKDLSEVADAFEMFASDSRAMIGRFSKTAKDRREHEIRAQVWTEAAEMLRNCTLTGDRET